MGHLGLLGRIMLILMGALSALVLATVAIEQWQRAEERPLHASHVPRLEQAAGIIALLRKADPADRPEILRAVRSASLDAEILDAPPAEADLIREPRLEARLRGLTGDPGAEVAAFTDKELLRPGVDPGASQAGGKRRPMGRMAAATARLADGRILVISTVAFPHLAMPTLLGWPLSVWVAVLGIVVSILALVGARHEIAPLRRLTAAVAGFDGRTPAEVLPSARGAPEIRRLTHAVRGMQERICTLLAERSLMIGAVSHDLKTYMTRLRLRVETLAEPDMRGRAVADLDAMAELIDLSLSFARGTAIEARRAGVDLADLVAAEVMEQATLGAPVSLSGDDIPDAVVAGDAGALRRVVANLIQNAVKFGRSQAVVTVEREGGLCRLTVEDDGPGIPHHERAAVFSPYYRVERSRNRDTGGTGLGLAIARQIVEAHGGTVTAGAAALGGARLVVELPAAG